METLPALLDALWKDYSEINPQAKKIHALLEARGEKIANDHVAFRTFAHPGLDLKAMAEPFLAFGYKPMGRYEFPEKKLDAVHYEHPDASQPKIFISELRLREISEGARSMLLGLINQVTPELLARPDWIVSGRPWQIDYSTYEALERESEYAAWMAAFGFRANHFTVFANALKTFPNLTALNGFLKAQGFRLLTQGGEIKGSAAEYLEQSSTLANEAQVAFRDGTHKIPACYYEFALRYSLPGGKLFQGFNAKSANKIFESTDRSAAR
jgi:hypothetical protein